MERADQGLSQDRLVVLQRGVRDHVHQLGHDRAPELDQSVFGRVRTPVAQGRGQVIEGGVGLRRGEEGSIGVGHWNIP